MHVLRWEGGGKRKTQKRKKQNDNNTRIENRLKTLNENYAFVTQILFDIQK